MGLDRYNMWIWGNSAIRIIIYTSYSMGLGRIQFCFEESLGKYDFLYERQRGFKVR